jgi:hypothetical protein
MNKSQRFKEIAYNIASDRTREERLKVRSAIMLTQKLNATGIDAYYKKGEIIINKVAYSLEEAQEKFNPNTEHLMKETRSGEVINRGKRTRSPESPDRNRRVRDLERFRYKPREESTTEGNTQMKRL